jgi:hypothetical protein
MESLIRAFPLIEVSIRTSSRKLRSVLDVFYQAVKTGEGAGGWGPLGELQWCRGPRECVCPGLCTEARERALLKVVGSSCRRQRCCGFSFPACESSGKCSRNLHRIDEGRCQAVMLSTGVLSRAVVCCGVLGCAAVLYPKAPLLDATTGRLTTPCVKALLRIFLMCDIDGVRIHV